MTCLFKLESFFPQRPDALAMDVIGSDPKQLGSTFKKIKITRCRFHPRVKHQEAHGHRTFTIGGIAFGAGVSSKR